MKVNFNKIEATLGKKVNVHAYDTKNGVEIHESMTYKNFFSWSTKNIKNGFAFRCVCDEKLKKQRLAKIISNGFCVDDYDHVHYNFIALKYS